MKELKPGDVVIIAKVELVVHEVSPYLQKKCPLCELRHHRELCTTYCYRNHYVETRIAYVLKRIKNAKTRTNQVVQR